MYYLIVNLLDSFSIHTFHMSFIKIKLTSSLHTFHNYYNDGREENKLRIFPKYFAPTTLRAAGPQAAGWV